MSLSENGYPAALAKKKRRKGLILTLIGIVLWAAYSISESKSPVDLPTALPNTQHLAILHETSQISDRFTGIDSFGIVKNQSHAGGQQK